MARTRSGKSTAAAPKKIKFSDDGEIPADADVVAIETREPTPDGDSPSDSRPGSEDESGSDSDSDAAPEEESISQAKSQSMKQRREQEKLKQEARRQERERRKQRDAQLKEQQQLKKQKVQAKVQQLSAMEQLPERLPEILLESDDEDAVGGTHLRSEHFEKQQEALRKKQKLDKLRQLKEMRRQAVNMGPVYVQVSAGDDDGRRVPKAEHSIVASKESWFQRESLNRK